MSADIESLRALLAAATPGPWSVHEMDSLFVGNRADGRNHGLWEIVYATDDRLDDLTFEAADRHRRNAALITAAVNTLPDLLDRLEGAEAALEPGKAPAIVAAMFAEAKKRGQSPFSSEHALTYLLKRLDAAEAERDRLEGMCDRLAEQADDHLARAQRAEVKKGEYREAWLAAEVAVVDEREQRKEAEAKVGRVEALAEEWKSWSRGRSTPRIDAFRDAAESLRAALRGD